MLQDRCDRGQGGARKLQLAVERLSESVHRLANFPDVEGGLSNDGITGHVSRLANSRTQHGASDAPLYSKRRGSESCWFRHANDGMPTVRPRG